ncbi:hypothetical protein TNCV_703671 [Trichonephila clavipes]|nr:hypothetical protein TNCV_703671 [Trichonephila clavipes]
MTLKFSLFLHSREREHLVTIAIRCDNLAASNNRDTDVEGYVENVALGENISSDDEEIDEIQCPSTSKPEVILCFQAIGPHCFEKFHSK